MEFLASSLGGQKRAEEEGGVRHPPVPLLHTTPSSREGTPSEQDEEYVLEMRDTAIQTTPSLELSSRPVAFTVASHLNQHISQHVCYYSADSIIITTQHTNYIE